MGLDLQKFVDGLQTPTKKLSITELREREDFWRAMWSWLDEDVKYFTLRVGQMFRVMRRDYKGSLGELGAVKFEPKEIELRVYEKSYNYEDGKYYYEQKVVKIPASVMAWTECISTKDLADDVEQFSVEQLTEEEAIV